MKPLFILLCLTTLTMGISLDEMIKRDTIHVSDSFHIAESRTLYYGSVKGSHPFAPNTVFILKNGETCYRSEAMELDEMWATGGTSSNMNDSDGELKLTIEFGGYSESVITAVLDRDSFPLRVNSIRTSSKPIVDNDNNQVQMKETWNFVDSKHQLKVGTAQYDNELIYATPQSSSKREFTLFPIWGGKNISSNQDIYCTGFVHWGDSSLTFTLNVHDNYVRPGVGIHSDHVEIWFSESHWWPKVRKHEDTQLLINFEENNVVASYGYPTGLKEKHQLKGRFKKNSLGYETTFEIPSRLLWERNIEFSEGGKIALSLIVSDSDLEGKQKTMLGTSKVKWGKPRTFGRLVLVEDDSLPKLNRAIMYRLD